MSTITRESLLEEYRQKIASYDEILDNQGQVKPAWQQLLSNVGELDLAEVEVRHREIIRQLRQNGVTYNVYDDPEDVSRPWQIDPMPFLIEAKDWQLMEKGIQQRSQLLNILLQDIYGSRHLLRDKVIPSNLLYRHKGFLRACHDLQLPQQCRLVIHGLDMARGPKGQMWVLSDRASAPSGMGYALENRKVMNQLLPELSQDIHAKPIDPFFVTYQKALLSLLPHPKESPFIVYLTPGPMNETYFEHSYLASYMGYTLVQGSDLVVRDGFVWLKGIDGLQKVDVIIRRIDDSFCDPLELNANSMLGVAGLLEVMRRGNVSVVNPPGSSIIENRGLFAFMNAICKYYLNEELQLPNMATWWCGQEKELKYVLENLEKLVIKKIDRGSSFNRVYGSKLSQKELEELKEQIKSRPDSFIGHEEIGFSSLPSFVNGRIEPRMAALRCYSIATSNGYQVMPGGLTRTSPEEGVFSVSNRYGGISKDTWIVDESSATNTEERVSEYVQTNTHHISLSSRSAENLFWVGRMTERSIVTTGFLNIVLDVWTEHKRNNLDIEDSPLKLLLKALTNLTITYPGFIGKGAQKLLKKPSPEILDLATNPNRMGSVPFDLQALGNAAISIREHISLESWKALDLVKESQLELQGITSKKRNVIMQIQQHLQTVNHRLFTFYGTLAETMPRHEGRLLFKAGKLIERSLASIAVMRTLLGFKQPPHVERVLLEKVLVYQHSLTHYRLRYRSDMNINTTLDTLLYATHLPYALLSQLEKLETYLKALPLKTERGRLNAGQKLLLSAKSALQLTNTDALAATAETGFREHLDETLSQVAEHLLNLSSALTDMYFNHTQTQYL